MLNCLHRVVVTSPLMSMSGIFATNGSILVMNAPMLAANFPIFGFRAVDDFTDGSIRSRKS